MGTTLMCLMSGFVMRRLLVDDVDATVVTAGIHGLADALTLTSPRP
jgi:hypothetical protein